MAVRTGEAFAMYLRGFLIEVGLAANDDPVAVASDARDVLDLVHGTRRPAEKNLQGDYSLLRHGIARGHLKAMKIAGVRNPADVLTKGSPSADAKEALHRLTQGAPLCL